MNETPSQTDTATTLTIPFIVKGNMREYRKRLGLVRPIIAALIPFYLFFRFGFETWLFTVIFLVALISLGVFLIRRRQLEFTETGIIYRDVLNRKTSVAYSEIESAKLFSKFFDAAFGETVRLTIADKAHKKLISLQAFYFNREDILKASALLQAKNVTVEKIEADLSYRDVANQYPAYATYIERKTGLVAVVASIVVVVLVVVVALLITFN